MQERVQHTETAIHVRLCVARALYLRDKTERKVVSTNQAASIKLLSCKSVRPYLRGMCNRRYRSTEIASSDSTEA